MAFLQVYRSGIPARLNDTAIIRKDGTLRHIEISVYLRRNKQGNAIGYWGISRDRTEKKLAEIAMKESEEQYRLLAENANDAIYIIQQGRIKYHNPRTSQM